MTSRAAEDRRKWEELYASGARPDRPPSAWVVGTVATLPNDLPVVDIAGGTGRHAVPVERTDRHVVLVDIAQQAVASAKANEPRLDGVVADAASLPLRRGAFGIVMVVNFLDRETFPELISLLAPGGYLVYETYTTAHLELVRQGAVRGPSSAEYLLHPDELRGLARPLTMIDYWEGEVEDEAGRRCCARLVGQSAKRKVQSAEG